MGSKSIVLYGCGETAKNFYLSNDRYQILAVVSRKKDAGKSLWGGVNVQEDSVLNTIKEPFDLVIASLYYDIVYMRLQKEKKLDNPNLDSVFALNLFKLLPPFSTDAFVTEEHWRWVKEHFKDDYSQHIIELLQKNRGNAEAEDYLAIKDVLPYAGDEDYWKTVKGRNFYNKAVVFDLGAYVGDSIDSIVKAIDRPIEAYYALEPMEQNFVQLAKLKPFGIKNFYPMNKAVGKKNEIMTTTFIEDSPAISSLIQRTVDNPVVEISVITLDSLYMHENKIEADFYIKMDIEGSELVALQGAERLICEKRPNLAVCLYHKADDIYEIPQYIDSLNIGYEFHLSGGNHTIMIAVPNR